MKYEIKIENLSENEITFYLKLEEGEIKGFKFYKTGQNTWSASSNCNFKFTPKGKWFQNLEKEAIEKITKQMKGLFE